MASTDAQVNPPKEVFPAAGEVPSQAETEPNEEKMAKSVKEKMPRLPKATPAHPPYFQMIKEAISALKEKGGSSPRAIAKIMEEKHKAVLSPNYKKMLAIQIKKLVLSGKLVKVKGSFKLSEEGKKAATKKIVRKTAKPATKAASKVRSASKPAGKTASKVRSASKPAAKTASKAKSASKPAKAAAKKVVKKVAKAPATATKTAKPATKKSAPAKKTAVAKPVKAKKPKYIKSVKKAPANSKRAGKAPPVKKAKKAA